MKRLTVVAILTLWVAAGCAASKNPFESSDTRDRYGNPQTPSPFYDATRPAGHDDMPALDSRSDEEREAFRERHR
jgi:hypothetical protein